MANLAQRTEMFPSGTTPKTETLLKGINKSLLSDYEFMYSLAYDLFNSNDYFQTLDINTVKEAVDSPKAYFRKVDNLEQKLDSLTTDKDFLEKVAEYVFYTYECTNGMSFKENEYYRQTDYTIGRLEERIKELESKLNLKEETTTDTTNSAIKSPTPSNYTKLLVGVNKRPVLQFTKDKVFLKRWDSLEQFGAVTGKNIEAIAEFLRERYPLRRSSQGFYWEFADK